MLQYFKKLLKKHLPPEKFQAWRQLYVKIAARHQGGGLKRLAQLHGTDKIFGHDYIEVYEHHFQKFRKLPVNFLEIGVGGYDDPEAGGQSLRMWKDYFRNGTIHAIDIYDKSPHQESRIKIFQGSQADTGFLEKLHQDCGDFDLIIDDGSHLNEHITASFEILFPKLRNGGIYAIEDIQTAYWPSYGGQYQPGKDGTAMSYFRALVDGLNHAEFLLPDYKPTYNDLNIRSLHFYHNMVLIHKGANTLPSNLVRNGILLPH